MSRTKRHKDIRSIKPAPNKLKPYLAEKHKGSAKFTLDLGNGIGISKTGKLITQNANRSRKKAARQDAKKKIRKQINNDCD